MPKSNFASISNAVLLSDTNSKKDESLIESILKVQVNIGLMIVEIITMISISLVKFLRVDLLPV
jgi:hypothetical protein